MGVTSSADATEFGLAARTHLSRDETQPGGKLPSITVELGINYGGSGRRGSEGADAGYFLQTLRLGLAFDMLGNLLVTAGKAFVEGGNCSAQATKASRFITLLVTTDPITSIIQTASTSFARSIPTVVICCMTSSLFQIELSETQSWHPDAVLSGGSPLYSLKFAPFSRWDAP